MADKKEIWSAIAQALEQSAHAVLELECQRYLELDPNSFPVRMLLAHARVKMKRFGEAADLIEGANPTNEREVVLWHRTAGDYYAERGDYEAAEDEYASALALVDEQTADLVLDLVNAMINQGRSGHAIRAIDTYVAYHEDQEGRELLAYAKACALRNIGEYQDALSAAREAASLEGFASADSLIDELERRLASAS